MILELLSKIWFSAISTACLGIGIVLWTVQTWAAPYMPLVLCALGAAVVLGVILMSAREAQSSGQPGVAQDPKTLGLQVAPLVVALCVCALWLFSPVRQAAASVASNLNLLTIDSMHADSNPQVRASACRELLGEASLGEREALFRTLHESDELRKDCLQPELDAQNPLAIWIAKRIAQRWRQELSNADGASTDEQACHAAAQLVGLGRDADRVQLLHYTLQASSPKARQCFKDALGDIADISTIVGAPESVRESVADELLEPLTQRTFFETSAQDPGWSSEQNQRWVWSLACSMASGPNPTSQRKGVASLESMAHSLSCNWNREIPADAFESVGWPRLCQSLEEPLLTSPGSASLCPVIIPHLVELAVEKAKGLVAVAASSFSMHAAADDISNTPVGAGRAQTKAEAARAQLFSRKGADLFGDNNPHKPISCQNMMMRIFSGDEDRGAAASAFRQMGGADFNCGPRPSDLTIGENKAKLDRVRSQGKPEFDTYINRRYLNKSYGKDNVDTALKRIEEKANK